MGFSAVARVTEDRWVCCSVRDEIAFGLKPGGELKVETTLCNEIRGSGERVVIEHVAEDPDFRDHHTPALYGFQSYISVPIVRDGAVWGTLCAIDPRPALLKTDAVLGMFELFSQLIAFHLDAGSGCAPANRPCSTRGRPRSCASSSWRCWGTTCARRCRRWGWALRCWRNRPNARPACCRSCARASSA
ncbi:GAF domain-containing protein [Ramlibacter terrae]|uniref:GAF domain-containing protein n=1 Tax=Ramlibacter terrae TaxID=2732511 RepID=A0ABX6PA48_9BURK|nr:GAF domain-containing protein [Ramlibacter terrae]